MVVFAFWPMEPVNLYEWQQIFLEKKKSKKLYFIEKQACSNSITFYTLGLYQLFMNV